MSKTSLFATSLIGALPGAFLAYLCVMAFLNYAGGGSVLLKVVTGLLLVVGLAMPVLSVAALLSGRGDGAGKSAAKPKKDKKSKQDSKAEAEEDQPASGESAAPVTAEIANTGEVEEFDLDDDFADDFSAEDEDEPKKMKKK